MDLAIGTNKKLGKTIGSWSREVGPTCPTTCPFLRQNPDSDIPIGQRCYAEKLQARYPSVKKSWKRRADFNRIYSQILSAKELTAVRVHVGGDFITAGQLDRAYLSELVRLILRLRAAANVTPFWFYTHTWSDPAWSEIRPVLEHFGCQTFASVHNEPDALKAIAAGWRLAIDPGQTKSGELPVWSLVHGQRALTCPEQRGRADCSKCGYCFRSAPKSGSHVAFFRH